MIESVRNYRHGLGRRFCKCWVMEVTPNEREREDAALRKPNVALSVPPST